MIIWIIIAIFAALVDLITANVFFVSFSFGSLAALLMYYFQLPLLIQVIAFIVISSISMIVSYAFVRKFFKKNVPVFKTKEEELIGKEIILDKDIENEGQIKVDGIYWLIRNAGEEPLKAGDRIKIINISENRLIVKKGLKVS
jgi:membrane protein implicated in regulation of membrane protease activity